jgi:anti-sigma regulatory factor (Ser/Thr protein kinase)
VALELSGGVRTSAVHGDRLEMVLNNTVQAIEDGRQELLAFFESRSLDARALNRLEVIFEEMVSNAVRHGFAPGSAQSIHVRVATAPEGVELTLEDDGVPFNPFEPVRPRPPLTSLETAPLGGLGIPLVVRLSTTQRYERPGPPLAGEGFAPTNRVTVLIGQPAV